MGVSSPSEKTICGRDDLAKQGECLNGHFERGGSAKARSVSFPEVHSPALPSQAEREVGEVAERLPCQLVTTQPDLPFKLTGSQKKTEWALRQNCERMCKEAGIGRIGFLTLTFARKGISQDKAAQLFNSLNSHVIKTVFNRAIVVTQRMKSGELHFHLVGELKAGFGDIRTGFNFEEYLTARAARREGRVDARAESDYKRDASPALRALWRQMRRKLPRYGFGRHELIPVRKTAEAVSAYVSRYIEKNLYDRRPDDKRKKLVRYLGWNKEQLKANGFSWANPEWRLSARLIAKQIGINDKEEMKSCFGRHWAWLVTQRLHYVDSILAGHTQEIVNNLDWLQMREFWRTQDIERKEREDKLNIELELAALAARPLVQMKWAY